MAQADEGIPARPDESADAGPRAAPEDGAHYDRPAVEAVMTAQALAREIHYAGTGSGQQDG